MGSGAKAFEYVARYVQKTALDASRITAVDEDSVSFRWTDRASGNERFTKLSGEEFIRRFLQHVLPRGFMRVRHFGWLSAAQGAVCPGAGSAAGREAVLMLPDKPAVCCPACGCAMKFLHALRPRARPPPGIPSFACPT